MNVHGVIYDRERIRRGILLISLFFSSSSSFFESKSKAARDFGINRKNGKNIPKHQHPCQISATYTHTHPDTPYKHVCTSSTTMNEHLYRPGYKWCKTATF